MTSGVSRQPRAGVSDSLADAARELLELGIDGFSGPATDEFVDRVIREHPAAAIHRGGTAKAMAGRDLGGLDPEEAAREVFRNFAWTHFVCKLIMTASPEIAVEYARDRLDIGEITASVESEGAAILSCFHYTGYPLVAFSLILSPVDLVISKARVDVMERSKSRAKDNVVYLSDRSAAIRLARALKGGRSVWILVDVVLPTVRATTVRFLGRGMNVGAGLGRIARAGGRPCLPLFWELGPGSTRIRTGPRIAPGDGYDEALTQELVDTQAAFVRDHPTHWLEWYSALEEAPALRKQVKAGNEAIWDRIAGALER